MQISCFGSSEKAPNALPAPPRLRTLVSLSCGISSQEFLQTIQNLGVQQIWDIRLTPTYVSRFKRPDYGSDQQLFREMCTQMSVEYRHVPIFAPTQEMRHAFNRATENSDTRLGAWTSYLEDLEVLMQERRAITLSQEGLNQAPEVVAAVCSCHYHDDCHRSYVTAMLHHYIQGVYIHVVDPNKEKRRPKYPRRWRQHDFPMVGLLANAPQKS
ncbi:DUF488 domain-containing protein [Patescibacteria group bacterium]|nr:DUF488 domain-containing protein [Patescibacteria group bacterium]